MSGGVAVVTGAASGIGLATAADLADAGSLIVGVDLAEAPGGAPAEEWVRGDVTSPDTWRRVDAAVRYLDPRGASSFVSSAADIVVAPFLETGIDAWRHLFEVNALALVRGMHALMPAMIARGRGAIAVVCSVDSLYADPQLSAYATSKAALLHVVRSAALEHARHGLRINAVCPGSVDTPLLRRVLGTVDDPDAVLGDVAKRVPAGRLVRPEEVAAVLRFLVSDAASGLSGAAITVDGGLTTSYEYGQD